jgi:hypothetical protein
VQKAHRSSRGGDGDLIQRRSERDDFSSPENHAYWTLVQHRRVRQWSRAKKSRLIAGDELRLGAQHRPTLSHSTAAPAPSLTKIAMRSFAGTTSAHPGCDTGDAVAVRLMGREVVSARNRIG